jgi:hypothetical protein
VSKPFGVGAYAYQRLNLVAKGKAYGRDSQGFKPDLGNSAVRHYAMENMPKSKVEMHTLLLCTDVLVPRDYAQCSQSVARHS